MFDFGIEWTIDQAVGLLKGLAHEFAQGLFDAALEAIEKFLLVPTTFDQHEIVQQAYTWIFQFSVALGTLFLLFNVAKYYTQSAGGYESRQPAEIFIKAILGGAGAASAPWIMSEMLLGVNNLLVVGLTDYGVDTSTLEQLLIIPGTANVVISFLVLAIMILLLVMAIQATIRLGYIVILLILSPIAFWTMQNEEINIFPIWWRESVAVVFQQAYQLFFLMIVLRLLAGGTGPLDYFLAIGLMWGIVGGVSFLRKALYYSTGSGRAAIGMAGSAGKMAMYKLAAAKIVR